MHNDPLPEPGEVVSRRSVLRTVLSAGIALRRRPFLAQRDGSFEGVRPGEEREVVFWTAADLEEKLRAFQDYFNKHRVHSGLKGQLPDPKDAGTPLNFASYRWQKHCRGLYQTPVAA